MTALLPPLLKALGLHHLACPTVFVPKSPSSAFANSQVRHLGGIMAGAGGVVCWASYDIASRRVPLAMVAGGVEVVVPVGYSFLEGWLEGGRVWEV
jgi:drug/metabolite transporter (DMT)-like permease